MSLYKAIQYDPMAYEEERLMINECLYQLGVSTEDEGNKQILCYYLEEFIKLQGNKGVLGE